MKCFYAGTFMNKEELKEIGKEHPIKLEYYKTMSEYKNRTIYGLEVIKTEYSEKVKVENASLINITEDERKLERVLDLMKIHKVTPITAEYVVEDLFKN